MQASRNARLLPLGLLALLALEGPALGQRSARGSKKGRGGDKAGAAQASAPAKADAAADKQASPAAQTPAQAQAPPAPIDRPLAALRIDCSDGADSPSCQAAREGGAEAAAKAFRLIEARRVEEIMAREPALRSCRRDDCRIAISDQLQVPKLLDISIQVQGGSASGTVLVFDAAAKGISADAGVPQTRQKNLRKAIADAVDYVIAAQKLTATLKLSVQPEGARVKIDGNDRGSIREVRLFLGPHALRIEKPGFIPDEKSVNITAAGATLEVRLSPQPIAVRFDWQPPDARVLVDGDPVDAKTPIMDLVEGRHRVQALAPPGSGFVARDFDINVWPGMEPVVRFQLQREAQLHIVSPRGYTVRVDDQMIQPGVLSRLHQEAVVSASPGTRQVTATSWRGMVLRQRAEVASNARTEVNLRAPALWPGLLLSGLGVVGLATGGAMIGLHGSCINQQPDPMGPMAPPCQKVLDFSWLPEQPGETTLPPPIGGYVILGLGGAALISGAIWFGVNAANHPLFHRPSDRPAGGTPAARLPLRLALGGSAEGGP